MSDQTAKWTKIGFRGEKMYQKRARKALPLLVRQAKAEQPILYSDLADELEMPNPRNLNYPLGAIGNELIALSQEWGVEVPPLQALVINKHSGLPGEGISFFAPDAAAYEEASTKQRRAIVDRMLGKVYEFDRWDEVLRQFKLEPAESKERLIEQAARGFGRGGESEQHRSLKEFVAEHPESVGLPANSEAGAVEFALGSGDCLDVLFRANGKWLAVEVKTSLVPVGEIARGLFQCVKYLALSEATQRVEQSRITARVVLALEGSLPAELVALRNMLGVAVIEEVRSRPEKDPVK